MADDTILQEAIEALRLGDKAKAKDLLTRLLKTDQGNAQYWIWMSAATDTVRERVYCLETALRLDPENAAAKRGLVIYGALAPEDTVQPFPLNRPRQWEEELQAVDNENKPRGFKALMANSVARLVFFLLLGAVIIGGVITALRMPRIQQYENIATNTPGPSPTFTLTPTFVNATAAPLGTPVSNGPPPLWMLLDSTYTPTPVYVSTPRNVLTGDIFRAAQHASGEGQWADVIIYLQQVATLEPQSADPYYYMAEAYINLKDYNQALAAYEQAITINPNLGPAYVGRARMTHMLRPKEDILADLDKAIEVDPKYPNAYLERSVYYLDKNDPQASLADLQLAQKLAPDSPLVPLYYAQIYLKLGDKPRSLAYAQKANQLDQTLLASYRILGQAYILNGQPEKAMESLSLYIQYEPQDPEALVWLGAAYNADGQYETALRILDSSVRINNKIGEAFLQRGLSYIGLKNGPSAEYELKTAARYFPDSFQVTLGLIQAAVLQEHFGDAYLAADNLNRLAETDEERADVYYWRAYALEKLDRHSAAIPDWEALLALPQGSVPPERLAEAQKFVKAGITPTVTPTITRTPIPGTSTPTPKPGTPTPTRTPTSTPKPQ